MKELEKFLSPDDYNFNKGQSSNTFLIIEFMSQIRKLPLKKIKTFDDLFTNCIEYTTSICKAERYDYVYDSYLESSLKEGERIHRRKDCKPLEFNSFTMLALLPHQIQRFWVSYKNKELLQILSREYITNLANKDGPYIVLSGYITNNKTNLCIVIKNKTNEKNQN